MLPGARLLHSSTIAPTKQPRFLLTQERHQGTHPKKPGFPLARE